MKGWALIHLFSAILISLQARAAVTFYEKLEGSFDATGEPMRVHVVHNGRAGCEPKCAEWISAEGMIVEGSAQQFGKVVNSLRGRKIPILLHSRGGSVLEAMLIGTLIRARGLDVAIGRTDLEPCSSNSSCKPGLADAIGRPGSNSADCFSACTFVLAGGVHRSIAPGARIGVTSFRFPQLQKELWRKSYGGKVPFDDFIQLRMIPARKPWIVAYFRKMGVEAEIADIMFSVPADEIRVLSEADLARLKLTTGPEAGQTLLEQLAK